jgi:hypothetical protein
LNNRRSGARNRFSASKHRAAAAVPGDEVHLALFARLQDAALVVPLRGREPIPFEEP